MTYTKQEWIDQQTVISAARMDHIESGVEAAHGLADGLDTRLGAAENAITALEDANAPQEALMTAASGIEWRSAPGTVKRVGGVIFAYGQFNASSAWGTTGPRATLPEGYAPGHEVPISFTTPGSPGVTVDMWISTAGEIRAIATSLSSGYIKFFISYPAP